MTISPWSIEAWCESQLQHTAGSDWSALAAPSVEFLQRLDLSPTHPFCDPATAPLHYAIPGVPGQGPLLSNDHLETWSDVIITVIAMGAPSLAAMAELWLRLLSSLIAPLGIAHLLYTELQGDNLHLVQARKSSGSGSFSMLSVTCIFTTAASAVLLTDTLYVLEYGPIYGGALLCMTALLSWRICARFALRKTRIGVVAILLLAAFLIYDPHSSTFTFGDPNDAVRIDEGLYYDASNELSSSIVQLWPASYRTYTPETGATPWFPTGDSRTGLPFLLNSVPAPAWTRVWLPLADGEVLALDIAFPVPGHDVSKPVYLVLHGLNGGSQEEYVKDFALRRIAEGATVAVMVARGLMDLPVRGMNVFHGARWEDSHQAALQLRQAVMPGQFLAGVGYSMGAIILSNMVARTGSECALDAAVAVSGGLDMRQEIHFPRAQRLWQPLLTAELRDTFVVGKWGERVRQRLTKDQMKELMRATHVSEIDKTAVVAYNGFRDLVHYYSEMSALGDVPFPSDEYAGASLPSRRRIHDVAIPFCVVHALDDPLVTWRSVAANEGLMHPRNLTTSGSGNLFVLLTKRGGHVGWPLGWTPFVDKWKWMSDVSVSFISAVAKANAEQQQTITATL